MNPFLSLMVHPRFRSSSLLLSTVLLTLGALTVMVMSPNTSLLKGDIASTTSNVNGNTNTTPILSQSSSLERIIQEFQQKGVLDSTAKDMFIDRTINRAEAMKIIFKAEGKTTGIETAFLKKYLQAYSTPSTVYFTDVPIGAWYSAYIGIGVDRGILSRESTLFHPDQSVTRAEFAKMLLETADQDVMILAKTYEKTQPEQLPQDIYPGAWYQPYIYAALHKGIISYATEVKPDEAITRGEAFKMLYATFPPVPGNAPTPIGTVFSGVYEALLPSGLVQGNNVLGKMHLYTVQTLQRKLNLLVSASYAPVPVSNGVLFSTGKNEVNFWCATEKKLCWKFQTQQDMTLPPLPVGDIIYLVSGRSIVAIEKDTGKERAKIEHTSTILQIDAAYDKLFVLSTSALTTYDIRTRTLLWNTTFSSPVSQMRRYVDRLYVLTRKGEVFYLPHDTGKAVIQTGEREATRFLLLGEGIGALVGDKNAVVYVRNSVFEKGMEIFFPTDVLRVKSAALDDRVLAVVVEKTDSSELIVFKQEDGNVLWKKTLPLDVTSDLYISGKTIMLSTKSGKVQGYHLLEGTLLWTYNATVNLVAGIAIDKETLYIPDERGNVHEVLLKGDTTSSTVPSSSAMTTHTGGIPSIALVEELPWNIAQKQQQLFALQDGFVGLGMDGTVRKYSGTDGKIIWEKAGYTSSSRIAMTDTGTVAIATPTQVHCIDSKTGTMKKEIVLTGNLKLLIARGSSLLLQQDNQAMIYSDVGEIKATIPLENVSMTYFIDAQRFYVQKSLRTVSSYNLSTGALLWNREFSGEVKSIAEGVRGVLVVALASGEYVGVDGGNGVLGWKKMSDTPIEILKKTSKGLFALLGKGRIVELVEETGEIRATIAQADQISNFYIYNDTVFAVGFGNLMAFDIRTAKLYWTLTSVGRSFSQVLFLGDGATLPTLILAHMSDGSSISLRPAPAFVSDVVTFPSSVLLQDSSLKKLSGDTLVSEVLIQFIDAALVPKNGTTISCLQKNQTPTQLTVSAEPRVKVTKSGVGTWYVFIQNQNNVPFMQWYKADGMMRSGTLSLRESSVCGG